MATDMGMGTATAEAKGATNQRQLSVKKGFYYPWKPFLPYGGPRWKVVGG
ncbi:hypothetical protein GCM10011378_13870 [Hymenobacter glacieicola]|uniref:Uncharacterized protein n=1 Tax=Hymenobacter glacieicola TaxID=1562124 RepID=A0ABQ1WNI0_9BACT|nr:hypothetical protein GCM10011378_13870 [Hymenobacter glacieicola]